MIIAIDTGGTKTLVASFNKKGVLTKQTKFPTPHDKKEYITELKKVLLDNYSYKNIDAIVIAIPGVIKDGVVKWCGNLPWVNFNVKKSLTGVLGDAPVYIENDAKLAGLGETRFLKKVPPQSLYVTVSTGIGSGIITNGRINPALRNSESGHALIEYDGVVQEWERFASGQAIYKTYKKYASEIHSKRVWNKIADRISRGFLAVIPILQPDVIIIGGSIGTYFKQYGDQLKKILEEKLPKNIDRPKIIQAKYPELAVIYGCYFYAIDEIADRKSKK